MRKLIALIAFVCFAAIIFTGCASQPEPKDETTETAEADRDRPHGEEPRPEGERKPEGERGPDGERKPEGERGPDGERKPEGERGPDGERKPEGERGPEGEKPSMEDLNEYAVYDLTFGSPADLKMEDIGGGAQEFKLLHQTDPNTVLMTITFYMFPETAMDDFGDLQGLMAYGKSTYLATSNEPKEIAKRRFMDKEITGEILDTTIPQKSVSEAYVLPVKGSHLFLGIKTFPAMRKKLRDEIVKALFDTLK